MESPVLNRPYVFILDALYYKLETECCEDCESRTWVASMKERHGFYVDYLGN